MDFDFNSWPTWLFAAFVILTALKVYVPFFETLAGKKTQREKINDLEKRLEKAEDGEKACEEKYKELSLKYASVFAFASVMDDMVRESGFKTLAEFLAGVKENN